MSCNTWATVSGLRVGQQMRRDGQLPACGAFEWRKLRGCGAFLCLSRLRRRGTHRSHLQGGDLECANGVLRCHEVLWRRRLHGFRVLWCGPTMHAHDRWRRRLHHHAFLHRQHLRAIASHRAMLGHAQHLRRRIGHAQTASQLHRALVVRQPGGVPVAVPGATALAGRARQLAMA